jgi:hypothetical protein
MRGVLAGYIEGVGPDRLWLWLGPDWILVPRQLALPSLRIGASVVVTVERRRGLLWALGVRPQQPGGTFRRPPDRSLAGTHPVLPRR